jgi:hypothetical protein
MEAGEPARGLTYVLELVSDHGRDRDGVPDPEHARDVILVCRADLELALLEEEDFRGLVPVEDWRTPVRRDGDLQGEQLTRGICPEALIVVASVTTSECSPRRLW